MTNDKTSELSLMTKSTRSMKHPVLSEQIDSLNSCSLPLVITTSVGSTLTVLPKSADFRLNISVPGIGPEFLHTICNN